MNVLVIPEDFRHDQYVLKPIIEAMLKAAGKPRTKVIVCKDPLLGSVEQALKWDRIRDIISRYRGMTDLFLLCVDRDGVEGRRSRLDEIEQQVADFAPDCFFLAENAWQELEVWLLAGHSLPGEWAWQEIRAHQDPKEAYYIPYAKSREVFNEPGEGRKTLGREAASRYTRIRARCPEDIAALENKIRESVAGI